MLPQLGMRSQQAFERQQAPGDALGVVEPVDPHQQPLPPAHAKRAALSGGVGLLRQPAEPIGVDTHGEDPDGGVTAAVMHDGFLGRSLDHEIEQLRGRDREVPGIGGGVKTDEVGPQQTLEDELAGGQHAEDFEGGKRDMEEEPDPGARDPLPQSAGTRIN